MLGSGVLATVFFRHFRKSGQFPPKPSSSALVEQLSANRVEVIVRRPTPEGEPSSGRESAIGASVSEKGAQEQAELFITAIHVITWVTATLKTALAVCVREVLFQRYIVTITAEIITKTDMLVRNNERRALLCRETEQLSEWRDHAIEAIRTAQELFRDIERRFQQLEQMEGDRSISFFTLFPKWMSISRLYFIRALIANDAVRMSAAIIQNPYQKNGCLSELGKMAETVKGITENIHGARDSESDLEVSSFALSLSSQVEQEISDIKAFLTVFAEKHAKTLHSFC